MKASIILCIVASFIFSTEAFADTAHGGKAPGPCQQILKPARMPASLKVKLKKVTASG